MTYSAVPAFRPQIYSYQSRSRFRQYPRQVVTSIPGAGYAVKNLVWGDQAIDLSGLGTAPPDADRAAARWFLVTPAIARVLGNNPELGMLLNDSTIRTYMGFSPSGTTVYMRTATGGGTSSGSTKFSIPVGAQVLSYAEVLAALAPVPQAGGQATPRNRTPLYIGIGLGAAALLGGGYYLMKRGKKAA